MATSMESSNTIDTIMNHGDQEEVLPSQAEEGKATYKSFKKKFRKMKIKFDEAMRQSNENYLLEQKGIKKARQLAIENDQILEMLLDQNNSAQMPLHKRIDITTTLASLRPVPSLIDDDELESFADAETPQAKALYAQLRTMSEDRARSKAMTAAIQPKRSLASLLADVPHMTLDDPQCPRDYASKLEPLDANNGPPGYLTPDQIDDYIESLDIKLGLEQPASHIEQQEAQASQPDASFGNSHSPYNWLRRNVPHIFLQDGEGSEKSQGKPGALRGAGKRASIPAPSKPDALEIVEEDGLGYDFALGGPVAAKGKRKRDDDDPSGGYHPKTGRVEEQLKIKKPRASKKSKVSDDTTPSATPTATKRRKPRAPKNQTPDVTGSPRR